MGAAAEQVVAFEEALAMVRSQAARRTSLAVEEVALLEGLGRVLAVGIVADRDQPPFDRATRDGFAVKGGEVEAGTLLRVAGEVRAGEVWTGAKLEPSCALGIMTGAPMPDGADAVLMVEHVEQVRGKDQVRAARGVLAGENVVMRGSEARAGQVVVDAGTRMGAAEIAMAANCGCATLRVYAKPLVAIVATGDELVEVVETPEAQQIRNSNSYAIAAMWRRAGAAGRPGRLAIAKDTREDVEGGSGRGGWWI